jgi:hypothetical protein
MTCLDELLESRVETLIICPAPSRAFARDGASGQSHPTRKADRALRVSPPTSTHLKETHEPDTIH